MSTASDPNRTLTDTSVSQWKAFRIFGALMQLVAIALCYELLLGISDGIGPMLRLFLLTIIMSCFVLRLAWLAFVALQISLIVLEPRHQQLAQAPSGLFFTLIALFAIVAAMKLPQTHRFVSDYFLRLFTIAMNDNPTTSSTPSDTKQHLSPVILSLAIHVLQMTLVVILALFLLSNLPIGRQSDSWLQWSLRNGQAVWPGALLLVFVISISVLVREFAWRQLEPSQASLYLRSVKLIAYYRDLSAFERLKQRRKKPSSMKQTDSKGLK